MKALLSVLLIAGLGAPPAAAASRTAAPGASLPGSMLEAVEAAAASGAWRAQNTPTITTGRIRSDDRKRSALAYALSGAAAFAGAALWRWVPCRGASATDTSATGAAKYNKCYTADGERKGLDTPTKYMLAAGVTLEVVSLAYWIAHLRQGDPASTQP